MSTEPIDDAGLARLRAMAAHDPRAAIAAIDEALRAAAASPRDADLHALRGHCLRLVGDIAAAEASLRHALARAPAHDEAAASLAHLLRHDGRYRAAADVMVATTGAAPRDGDALQARLDFLRTCGADDAALALADAHRDLIDTNAGATFARAELLFAAGAFDAAAKALHRTLALAPEHAGALLRLAHVRRFTDRDDDIARFLLAQPAPSSLDARVALAFARGKLFDDLGDIDAAHAQFVDGNRLAREAQPWDASAWSRQFAARIASPDRTPAPRVPGTAPIFVVGMPRSGTTLLASRLARHPGIVHRGEQNLVSALATAWRAAPSRDNAARLAAHAMRHLVRDDPPARYVLDKNPLNFRDLDAIAAMFPHARVIWCRRDARDTCLSLWMQYFAHPDCAFAYALPDIIRYHADQSRALATWPQRLGIDHRIVEYERFIADPDAELAALWQWLGLRRHQVRADPTLAPDAARTASAWQVRQPIHRDALGRWRRYAALLPALRDLDPSGLAIAAHA